MGILSLKKGEGSFCEINLCQERPWEEKWKITAAITFPIIKRGSSFWS